MDAFSALMRESLSGDDPTLRKCCLVRLIYEVRTIRKRLEFLVRLGSIGRTELVIMGMVPMFDWVTLLLKDFASDTSVYSGLAGKLLLMKSG